MVSLKAVLRKNKKKKDGKCPIAIRITKDRKTNYIFTGQYILEKDWNTVLGNVKKSHLNSARLNNYLVKELAKANDILLEVNTANPSASIKEIKNKIKRLGKPETFFDLAEQRVKDYEKIGTYSVMIADRSKLNNIQRFTKNRNLLFQDITVPFLNKFKTFCASELGHNSRTITNHLIMIRTLFNVAIKDGVVDLKYYLFGGENIKIRINSGLTIGLNEKEILKIEGLDLKASSSHWHTRNVWLFAFYFAGVRISDVLLMKWSDFKDGRLLYVMNKNEKPVSLKLPEKAKGILKHYKKEKKSLNDYVFPDLQKANRKDKKDIYVKIHTASRRFNRDLKKIAKLAKIDKNLYNHIARHSFGNIAGDKIHLLMLQKLYRHSDLKTTINYQANFIHKDVDDALDSVINF